MFKMSNKGSRECEYSSLPFVKLKNFPLSKDIWMFAFSQGNESDHSSVAKTSLNPVGTQYDC